MFGFKRKSPNGREKQLIGIVIHEVGAVIESAFINPGIFEIDGRSVNLSADSIFVNTELANILSRLAAKERSTIMRILNNKRVKIEEQFDTIDIKDICCFMIIETIVKMEMALPYVKAYPKDVNLFNILAHMVMAFHIVISPLFNEGFPEGLDSIAPEFCEAYSHFRDIST
jgi:hypothetical protein